MLGHERLNNRWYGESYHHFDSENYVHVSNRGHEAVTVSWTSDDTVWPKLLETVSGNIGYEGVSGKIITKPSEGVIKEPRSFDGALAFTRDHADEISFLRLQYPTFAVVWQRQQRANDVKFHAGIISSIPSDITEKLCRDLLLASCTPAITEHAEESIAFIRNNSHLVPEDGAIEQ